MDLHRRYDSLHKRYFDLKGDEFDLYDIQNASISYAYNTCGIEGNTMEGTVAGAGILWIKESN